MNIIVTGGAGFIGSNFVFHMLKNIRTCFLQRRLQSIQAVHTVHLRQLLIFWFWYTTELTDCLLRSQDAATTTDHIIFRKS